MIGIDHLGQIFKGILSPLRQGADCMSQRSWRVLRCFENLATSDTREAAGCWALTNVMLSPCKNLDQAFGGACNPASSFDFGSLANRLLLLQLRNIFTVSSFWHQCLHVYLSVCLSSQQPTRWLQSKGLFMQDHPLLLFLSFIPVQIIVLIARKAFELSDFICL